MIRFQYKADNERIDDYYIPDIVTTVTFDEDTTAVELFTELWRLATYMGYRPSRKTVKDLIEELEYRGLLEDIYFESEGEEE